MSKRAIDEIYEEGVEFGTAIGTRSTLQSNILRFGHRRFLSLDPQIEEMIRNETDIDRLQLYLDRLFWATSWDEVFEEKPD